MSDCNTYFSNHFWGQLLELMQSGLMLCTGFCPLTDGQIGMVIMLLKLYRIHYVSSNKEI